MIARSAGLGVFLAACAAIWLGYTNITDLRGTWAWEYRYVIFVIAVLLGLSLIDTVIERVSRLFGTKDH